MLDIIYVLGTVAFFALMLGYVAGCERLGRSSDSTSDSQEKKP